VVQQAQVDWRLQAVEEARERVPRGLRLFERDTPQLDRLLRHLLVVVGTRLAMPSR
jgi:hypothetical protein